MNQSLFSFLALLHVGWSADLRAQECIRITQQPESRVTSENCFATFEVAARWQDGMTQHLGYQWRKNGSAVTGATNRTYRAGPVTLADNNTEFDAIVRSDCQSVTSSVARLSVVTGDQPPTLNSFAVPGPANDTVILDFSTGCSPPDGRLAWEPASDSFNYIIDGLEVWRAALDCTGLRVCLITSPQQPGTEYTVLVVLVQDELGNPISRNSTTRFTAAPRQPVMPGKLYARIGFDQLILEWASGGALQSADSPTGPWNDVEFADSPFLTELAPLGCNQAGDLSRFYRVRWPSP